LLGFPESAIPGPVRGSFEDLIDRRRTGLPLAYLLGEREFFSLRFAVNRDVLVPRPESELLVEAALARLAAGSRAHVLDLGTGSGALAIAIKLHRPAAVVSAVDRSAEALALAGANASRHGVEVRLLQSDWYGALAVHERFDLIVCNPPYVASGDPDWPALRHEPRLALDGGWDGLEAIRTVLAGTRARLEPQGALLLEHGHRQATDIERLAATHGLRCTDRVCDLAGLDRMLALEPSPAPIDGRR
jgi:release factor glutamine methyltransferase